MLERFRGLWQRALTQPAKAALAVGLSPDTVTWIGTGLTVVLAFVLIPQGWLWQAAVALAVVMLADGVDGQMARLSGRPTTFGAFLDSSLDRIGDGAVFGAVIVFYAARGDSALWAAVTLAALVMGQVTSYVKARGEALGFTVSGGIAARADRVFVLLAGLLAAGCGLSWALPVAVSVLAAASTVTVGQRMAQVSRQARALDDQHADQPVSADRPQHG